VKDKNVSLTDWLVSDEELLKRIELALAQYEAEEYRKYVKDLFPWRDGYNNSVTVEEISRRTGISPKRIVELVAKYQPKLKFKKLRCKTRSKIGWCLRHHDYEYGVRLVDPELVEFSRELRWIRLRLRHCMFGPVVVPIAGEVITRRPYECGLDEKGIMELISKAAIIADKLGVNEEMLKEWLDLTGKVTFWLDDGRSFELEPFSNNID